MFACPFADILCPYYNENTGKCLLPNPADDCDDYIFYRWDEEEGLEWEGDE